MCNTRGDQPKTHHIEKKPGLKDQIVALSLQLAALQTNKVNGGADPNSNPDEQDTTNCNHPALSHNASYPEHLG